MNSRLYLTRQVGLIQNCFYLRPILSSSSMHKRDLSTSTTEQDRDASSSKRARVSPTSFTPIKISSAEAAARVDANTPLSQLTKLMDAVTLDEEKKDSSCVVYWMRKSDLRGEKACFLSLMQKFDTSLAVNDNKALSRASQQAQEEGLPLVTLFVISPQDYIAHDVGARKIDFMLRNLALIKVCSHTIAYDRAYSSGACSRNLSTL
jgi:deoxyribodipyrimidine photo-lyase